MLSVFSEDFRGGVSLLLGGFDGLHRGHLTLLQAARKSGFPVGLTALSGGKAGGDLFTLSEREYVFRRAGFSFMDGYLFDENLKNTSARDFMQMLLDKFDVRAIYCGEDFRFGRGAEGTPALLTRLARCPVFVLPTERANGEKISASHLKELVRQGQIQALNALLPYGYFLENRVEHGREVGRALGFPTVNLSFGAGKIPLMDGVYFGLAQTTQGDFPAVINVGARPTFKVTESKVEAHLLHFEGNLYGQTVRLFFKAFLRKPQAFADEEALKAQIGRDISMAREYL